MNPILVLPCTVFFAERRFAAGIVVLLMQMSLLLWPWAVRRARQLRERANVERVLAQLSETHRAPVDPHALPMKRFRQVA
jgi:hypothetical protein